MNKKIKHYVKKHIYDIKKLIAFKSSHISFWGKIGLLGVIICFVSLFFPWVSSLWTIISSGDLQIDSFMSFSSVLWRIGFFITIVLAIIVFSIFSIQKKEKFRYFSLINISDYISLISWSIFIFIISIHSFFLIWGLQLFSSNIMYGKGIILCITGALVMFSGALIMKQEYRKNIKGSYSVNNQCNDKQTQIEECGMDYYTTFIKKNYKTCNQNNTWSSIYCLSTQQSVQSPFGAKPTQSTEFIW